MSIYRITSTMLRGWVKREEHVSYSSTLASAICAIWVNNTVGGDDGIRVPLNDHFYPWLVVW